MDPVFESKLRTVLGCVLLSALLSQVYLFASPVGTSTPYKKNLRCLILPTQYLSRVSRKTSTLIVELAKKLYTIYHSFRPIIRDFVRPKDHQMHSSWVLMILRSVQGNTIDHGDLPLRLWSCPPRSTLRS